jgi:DNA-binding NtrC family response regulator
MNHDATTLETESSSDRGAQSDGRVDAFVVVWCRDEPGRVGEVALVPPDHGRRSFAFGRGASADGRHERLRLVKQRPGMNAETSPLETPHLSRVQLVVRGHAEGGIQVDNAGKRTLLVGGRTVTSGRAQPSELVEIRDQLVMLCVRRPRVLPAMRSPDARMSPPFGEADAFGYVGESAEAWRLRDEVSRVAKRKEHVLVLGESGVGKEIIAQAIHAMSARSGRKLVARNAATVPSGIIDAELFGSSLNYPNAGMPERPGLVGESEGSTLYLDEIGELPTELQTHLLRLLDRGDYQRLGDARRRTADVRVVAATNRPLEQLRSDLAARFAIRVRAAGLHERREDIPLVARHILRRIAADGPASTRSPGGAVPEVSKELAVALVGQLYATHVREMTNVLHRAWLESRGPIVELTEGARAMLSPTSTSTSDAREITREIVVDALARHEGVRERVWRDLGLANRYVLKRLMQKYGIRDDDES